MKPKIVLRLKDGGEIRPVACWKQHTLRRGTATQAHGGEELTLASAHAPPGGKLIPRPYSEVLRLIPCLCTARAAGVGLSTRVREKGQCVCVHTSEMRDRAGVTGLVGGCRTDLALS